MTPAEIAERVAELRVVVADHQRLGWGIFTTTTETVAALLDAAEENAKLRARLEVVCKVEGCEGYGGTECANALDLAEEENARLRADRDALLAAAEAVTAEGYCDGGDVVQILKAPWSRLGALCIRIRKKEETDG